MQRREGKYSLQVTKANRLWGRTFTRKQMIFKGGKKCGKRWREREWGGALTIPDGQGSKYEEVTVRS